MRVLALTYLVYSCCLLALLPACRERPHTADGAAQPVGAGEQQPSAAGQPTDGAAIRQLILLYTGDTLSIPQANDDYAPPEGGIGALVKAITDYEGQILYYNQQRVANAGGDASLVRADFERGMLGDNPFMLLDYGLWERPNDPAGQLYVKLFFDMLDQLHYTAAGCTLYPKLSAEILRQYAQLKPKKASLVLSTGAGAETPLAPLACVTRELYGQRWGVVGIPAPVVTPAAPAQMLAQAQSQLADSAAAAEAVLRDYGCTYSILLAPGGPPEFYAELARSKRFTVVLGGHPAAAVGVGRYPWPAGALILPALNGGGRELGICHVSFAAGGGTPSEYFFTRQACTDEGAAVFPYRQQVAAAVAEHAAAKARLKGRPAN